MKFELLVAVRYLKARRKQAVISLITFISILGVAAGVAALIIALAINAGFSQDLRHKLLGAEAHVSILSKDPSQGIPDYLKITHEIESVDGVVAAAPTMYSNVFLANDVKQQGVELKGILPDMESRMSDLAKNMVQGNLKGLNGNSIVVGQELAVAFGISLGDPVRAFSATFHNTPAGPMPRNVVLTVVGVFSSGLSDYDSSWVYVPLETAQRLNGDDDVANAIEVKVRDRDIDHPKAIGQRIVDKLGPKFAFTDWTSMNKSIFQALQLERLVMLMTIGLIVMVAALNIVATLIMMVLEKTRDIAILMSMGATQENIRRIFILQGVIIGVIGTAAGVVIGQTVCYFADKYRLISLAPDVYTIAYVPFRAQFWDSVLVAAVAILISFLATIYPSATASKLHPVEALRYE